MHVKQSIKKLILQIFQYRPLAKMVVILALKIHNKAYKVVGHFCQYIEKDRIHPKHYLMKYHQWFVCRLKKEWNVLDIGCGNGALTYDLKSNCNQVLGMDINEDNIKTAKSRFSRPGIEYICCDAIKYKFKNKFDAIVLSNVLEHIDDRVDFLKRIYANQNKANPPVLLLRVPMITRDWITLYKKEMGVEWRLDPTHFTEYTIEQVYHEIHEAGLEIESGDIQFGEFYGVIKKIK
jgi:SAM-dependent methyltransferase